MIAVRDEVTQERVVALLAGFGDLIVDGLLEPDSNLVVSTIGPEGTPMGLATIETARVYDDLEPELEAVVPDARWSLLISVPYGARPGGVRLAQRLARSIAREYHGAVYDPQADEIVSGGRRTRPSVAVERIALLEAEWFFPLSHLLPETPARLVAILRSTMPEAVPVRAEGRSFHPDRVEEFAAFWQEKAALDEDQTSWRWAAAAPFFEGAVYIRREPSRSGVPVWSLSLPCDVRSLDQSADAVQRYVTLFIEVARGLGAAFGCSYIRRNYILKRRTLAVDSKTEKGTVLSWGGLRDFPTWLTWFGEPYRDLVRGALSTVPILEYETGIFLRLGEQPRSRDELQPWFPTLPPQLITPPEALAEVIPPLE